MFRLIIVLISLIGIAVGCSSTSPNQAPPQNSSGVAPSPGQASQSAAQSPAVTNAVPKARLDACALLTSEEIKGVQGEDVKETKLTGEINAGIDISQCFFTLPTFTNSVSLVVAQKREGAGAQDPKHFWRESFHKDKRERERGEEEEEGESTPPRRIQGLGDEAFWVGSRIGGILYVLKADSYVRVSIGGPADQASKIKKSKILAQKVLSRL